MPAPWPPSELLKTIPSVSAAFCGRFLSFFSFARIFSDIYSYERDEQGDISAQFCSDIGLCIGTLPVGGGTPGGTAGTLSTPVISATDGTFTDHIVVSWNSIVPITGVTRYEVWRGDSNDVTLAHKIADVNTVTAFTDDGSKPTFPLISGQQYWYFVRAFDDGNPNNSSSYSQGDSGYEGTLIASLPRVTDLVASKGLSDYFSFAHDSSFRPIYLGQVKLRWTNVVGAQSYDIYRNTVDDYTTANRIVTNATFKPPKLVNGEFNAFDTIINNGADLAYVDSIESVGNTDPTVVGNFFYWVVPKRSSPNAIGPFSNANAGALGWAVGQGAGLIPQPGHNLLTSGGASLAVPALVTKAWVIVRGSSASGAGGNATMGGGGGGQGADVTGLIAVASVAKFRLVSVPEADPASGIHDANGVDGPVTKLQYSADGLFDDTIDLVTCNAPTAGLFNAGGGGAGGAGASATVNAALTPNNIYPGKAGFPAVTGTGGDSGYGFGIGRGPAQIYEALHHGPDAQAGHAGGGAFYNPNSPLLATGGTGVRGLALIVFYT